MTGELAQKVLPRIVEQRPARTLRWEDRGRLIAVETPAAVYVGVLTSFIMHAHEAVHPYIVRDTFKTDFSVPSDTMIYFGEA